MGFTALHMVWLLLACTFTTQELVKLKVSPKVTAECGKQVTLTCNTSSFHHELSIKLMQWSHEKTILCSVDSEEKITTHHRGSLSDFKCKYEDGRLSLIFQNLHPLESGNIYTCKQRSNKGAPHNSTKVELQECCGTVEGNLTVNGPACTFKHVYPDGDVHWFHGSQNLSDGSLRQYTTKTVENGWLTIYSHLMEWNHSHRPYNCSLKSTMSNRYIASTLVQKPERMETRSNSKTVTSQESTRTILCILILLAVIFE